MRSFLSILILTLCGSAMADAPVVAFTPVVSAPVVRYVVSAPAVYARPRVGFTGGVVATGYSVGRVRADDGSAVRKVRRTPIRTGLFGW